MSHFWCSIQTFFHTLLKRPFSINCLRKENKKPRFHMYDTDINIRGLDRCRPREHLLLLPFPSHLLSDWWCRDQNLSSGRPSCLWLSVRSVRSTEPTRSEEEREEDLILDYTWGTEMIKLWLLICFYSKSHFRCQMQHYYHHH